MKIKQIGIHFLFPYLCVYCAFMTVEFLLACYNVQSLIINNNNLITLISIQV